jgi:phospholipase C
MSHLTRRHFLKYAAAVTASGASACSAAIQKAAAILPDAGGRYLDAEHVVILMQENRSFDHAFGSLRGVRGFDDPRAITLPSGNPVWVQTNEAGESYLPFRLNLLDSKSTWMGTLPHSWTDQVDARNGGRYDRWLQVKRSEEDAYKSLPLALGFYDRRDIPFYYELADAFTICDQHFCSLLTGTTPNRSYLWTGTIRAEPRETSPAHLFNDEMDVGAEVSWATFPERLEDLGVSWKVYQNELYQEVGFEGEEGPWLSNFGDNPLEYFKQYQPWFAESRRRYLAQRVETLSEELAALDAASCAREVAEKREALRQAVAERDRWSDANFMKLPARTRSLHAKAFCTNSADPHFHQLTEFEYGDPADRNTVEAPKGDVLHQFRQDVNERTLPLVSWITAPERFSDHPGSAWYGAWYIAEIMNILTHNPEVWKKTIFILTYDENDGYFDHVPPFVAPHPRRPNTGRVSKGVDAGVEYVEREFEAQRRPPHLVRDSPIGLGYRVPMIVASPWSRGGAVCSQVFDHTSPLQFLETLLTHKLGREVRETNISQWRRATCGDLTSAFEQDGPGDDWVYSNPSRNSYIETIHRTQFKDLPNIPEPLSGSELDELRGSFATNKIMPRQEPGVRPSCALPYELSVEGERSADGRQFEIRMAAGIEIFGRRSAGAPFVVYSNPGAEQVQIRNYAVAAGDAVADSWQLSDVEHGRYHLAVHGPNGFFREFRGDAKAPLVRTRLKPTPPNGSANADSLTASLEIANDDVRRTVAIIVNDLSYGEPSARYALKPGEKVTHTCSLQRSYGWYDVRIELAESKGVDVRYAGRIETGRMSYSDPMIGKS